MRSDLYYPVNDTSCDIRLPQKMGIWKHECIMIE